MTTTTSPSTLPTPPSVLSGDGEPDPSADPLDAEPSASDVRTPGGDVEVGAERSRPSAGLIVASLLSLFVFALLNWPDPEGWDDLGRPLLFLDTTPSGGDMGAHVWGPAYLRDHLLASGRLSGWTPDWYAGFPAFHFYMVVPALAIVALNAGLPTLLGLPVAGLTLFGASRLGRRAGTARRWILAAGVLVAILVVGMPYGVAFKLVSVSGLVAFPLAGWAMARLAGAPDPVPAFVSMAAFIFLFDTNFTIYGGNVASTLAGEFAFSISLCLTLLAIGMVIRGLNDQRWRAPAAIVVALVALCHIIPVFFLIPALLLAVLASPDAPRSWAVAGMVAFALVPIAFADGTGIGIRLIAVGAAVVVMLSAMAAEPVVARRAVWLLLVGPTAILLSAFWLLPFYLREPYFNDMGWERLNDVGPALLTVPIKIALPVAAIGFLAALTNRERVGTIFGGTGLIFVSAVANLGEGPLWNARLLPFYYLSVYIVAAVGVAFIARYLAATVSGQLDRPDRRAVAMATVAGTLAVLIAVAMPLRIVPFGQVSASGDGTYRWLGLTNQARSLVPGWADWNYSGYEEKSSYGEYHHVVSTMAEVGEGQGCGRAMWEYEKSLDRYGTPMALMLLPHWTDGCIGSMEGLYFESSATTPFHFLNQSVLSEAPSRAQRDLPYLGFDIDIGVAQLQVMGVRYYLAQSDVAIQAAREHPDLTQVAEAQPFVVFQVDGFDLVEGLDALPVVTDGRTAEEVAGEEGDPEQIPRFEVGWVSQAVSFYNDPGAYAALPAEDGPDDWSRAATLASAEVASVEPVEVSDIDLGTDSLSFSVDRTGAPVLVKVSYFPNWEADGADGPWRVGPNLMVVVPTSERVELSYGRTGIDLASQGLSLLGLVAVVGLALLDRGRLAAVIGRRRDEGVDEPRDPMVEFFGPESLGPDAPDGAASTNGRTTDEDRSIAVDPEVSGDGPSEVEPVPVGAEDRTDADADADAGADEDRTEDRTDADGTDAGEDREQVAPGWSSSIDGDENGDASADPATGNGRRGSDGDSLSPLDAGSASGPEAESSDAVEGNGEEPDGRPVSPPEGGDEAVQARPERS